MAGPVLDRGIGGLRDKAKRYSVFSLARQAASYHTGWQQAWRHAEPKSEYDAVIIGGGGHGLTLRKWLLLGRDISLDTDVALGTQRNRLSRVYRPRSIR